MLKGRLFAALIGEQIARGYFKRMCYNEAASSCRDASMKRVEGCRCAMFRLAKRRHKLLKETGSS